MSDNRSALRTSETPTRARHGVLAFAVTLAIITYIDRVCISQAAPEIRRELGFSEKQMGAVFSAFTLAYALFEIPGGWLGDKFGPRSVLMKVVAMWSFFTAATGWAWNYLSMLVCRFLFGIGEAGCFPNLTKIFTIWLPSGERVRAQGILWLSARWGGAFTPLLVVAVLEWMRWRSAFMFFGVLGVFWALGFWFWFRDHPREHPSVNAAELALLDGAEKNAPGHGDVPWGKLVRSGTVWLLWLQYFCMSYGWYFYITWLPTYLKQRGVAVSQVSWFNALDPVLSSFFGAGSILKVKLALLAGVPLFFGGVGCFVGGWLAKRLAELFDNVAASRRGIASFGLAGAAAMLFVATRAQDPVLAMVALGLASFSNDLAMPSAWAACMDVGGPHAGSLSGSMNMMGNLGGAAGPFVVGLILESGKVAPDGPPSLESWAFAFLVAAAIYVIGALCWLFIDPVTPLESSG